MFWSSGPTNNHYFQVVRTIVTTPNHNMDMAVDLVKNPQEIC